MLELGLLPHRNDVEVQFTVEFSLVLKGWKCCTHKNELSIVDYVARCCVLSICVYFLLFLVLLTYSVECCV